MTAETRKALGQRIRALRTERGLSQQTLALMTGVERSYLAKLESGKRNPSIDCIEKLAAGLGVNLSDLFLGIQDDGTDAAAGASSANPRIIYRSPRP